MTKEELAAQLNGRQYTEEITPDEALLAKQEGLVVIFGASDDLCELRGAIHDELGAYKEATVFIKDGKLLQEIDDDDIEVLKRYGVLGTVLKSHEDATMVKAIWCKTPEYSWTFETSAI